MGFPKIRSTFFLAFRASGSHSREWVAPVANVLAFPGEALKQPCTLNTKALLNFLKPQTSKF